MGRKIIVQSLWIGPPLSDLEILSINSFIKCGHSFHLYVYDTVENIPKGIKVLDANQILPLAELEVLKKDKLPFSDIFRYKMLYEKGGYWVDLDMICLKKLNFKEKYIFSSERTIQKGGLRNRKGTFTSNIGILKAPRKSPFYLKVYLECMKKIKKRGRALKPIEFMVLMKKYIAEFELEKYIKPPEYFCPLDWWNTKEAFYPPCCPDKYAVPGYQIKDMLRHSYTIHMWRSLMRKKKINPNSDYSPDSLYEILKKKY
jgi:hypothetical protein